MGRRVAVTGGRRYKNRDLVWSTLDAFNGAHGIDLLIAGGARGADKHAQDWAIDRKISHMVLYADWSTFNKAAGAIRNRRMIDEGRPDIVIAFPGGKGTKGMRQLARRNDILVLAIKDNDQ